MYTRLKDFKDKEERARYVERTLAGEQLYSLESYKGNATPLCVLIGDGSYSGYIATITWGNFIKGKRPDFRSLIAEEKIRFINNMFNAEGYTVVSIPENVRVTDKIGLLSPKGNTWSVSIDVFKRGNRCPLDNNRSWGERAVYDILSKNGMKFKYQHTIRHEDNSIQYMDFLVDYEGVLYDIEYNGRQHYEDQEHTTKFTTFVEQKESDDKKKQYCADNNIIHVEIPYTYNTIQSVVGRLVEIFPNIDKTKEYSADNEIYNYDEIIEYYKTHTEQETSDKFGIAGSTVRANAYRAGFKKKVSKHSEGFINKVLKMCESMTHRDVADIVGITKNAVSRIRTLYKEKEVVERLSDKEIIDMYKITGLGELSKKLGMSRSGITQIARKHGFSKRKYKEVTKP